MTDPAVTYGSYLRLDELLSLQQPRSGADGRVEHDEMLFIVIHQVYELWFKQILWELDHVVELLGQDDRTRAGHSLHRVLRILKVLVGQLDVLETMTPLEFASFRDRLESASGFQSRQFRELERMLGLRDDGEPGSSDRTPIWPAALAHLGRTSPALDAAAASEPDEPGSGRRSLDARDGAAVRAALVAVYRNDPPGTELCERLVDLDEGLMEWRYRHLRMVQRTIGTKTGTGGSDGAAYLAGTIRPAFPDLWAIRTQL